MAESERRLANGPLAPVGPAERHRHLTVLGLHTHGGCLSQRLTQTQTVCATTEECFISTTDFEHAGTA